MNKRLKKLLAARPKKDDELAQWQRVARALLRGRKVSPLHAQYEFGCMRLAAVVYTLRYDFHMAVKTTMTKVKTRYGWARVAFYTYERKR